MFEKYEIEILRFFRSISNDFSDFLMEAITFFGEQIVIVAILAFFYFIYDKKIGKKFAYIIFTSTNLNGVVKGLVARTRPFIYDPTLDSARIETATGYSFPSGHTQNSFTVYFSIAHQFKKKYIWFICVVISILIALSRIILGVHYPTDVIAGAFFGLLSAFGASYIHDRFAKTYKSELLVYLCTFACFIPFNFIFFREKFTDIEIYKDFYKAFAMFAGFMFAFIIDEKYINFDNNVPLKTKLFRLLGAGISYLLINFGLKLILPSDNIFSVIFRYFLITFVTLGLYPLIFKNLLFKKKAN